MAGMIEIVGLEALQNNLRKTAKIHVAAFVAAGYQEAQRIADESHKRTPVDTKALIRSLFVIKPTRTKPESVIGYSAEHAIPVHERTELRHTVGEAKFLEKAFRVRASQANQAIAKDTRENIARGRGVGGVSARYPSSPPQIKDPR